MIATLHAAVAHMVAGKTIIQLPVFWLISLICVIVTYVIGLNFSHTLPAPAGVHLVETSLVAWIGIIGAFQFTK
jgi:hypothetical protein